MGSITAISDETGNLTEEFSFDPFGERRNADWTDSNTAISSNVTDHGYTSHEQLDDVDLIHMNARVYDPQIGRFVSADTFIPTVMNSEAFNRYTYVYNNPLSLTDPSGHMPSSLMEWIEELISKFTSKAFAGAARAAASNQSGIQHESGAGELSPSTAGGRVRTDDGAFLEEMVVTGSRSGGNLIDLQNHTSGVWEFGRKVGGEIFYYNPLNAAYSRSYANTLYEKGRNGLANQIYKNSFSPMSPEPPSAILLLAGRVGQLIYKRELRERLDSKTGNNRIQRLDDVTLESALRNGPERVAGFDVYGSKGMVGMTFNRNILLIESNRKKNIRELLNAFEFEARSKGARRISIAGVAIINPKLVNPAIAKRYGYSFQKVNKNTIILTKELN